MINLKSINILCFFQIINSINHQKKKMFLFYSKKSTNSYLSYPNFIDEIKSIVALRFKVNGYLVKSNATSQQRRISTLSICDLIGTPDCSYRSKVGSILYITKNIKIYQFSIDIVFCFTCGKLESFVTI